MTDQFTPTTEREERFFGIVSEAIALLGNAFMEGRESDHQWPDSQAKRKAQELSQKAVLALKQ